MIARRAVGRSVKRCDFSQRHSRKYRLSYQAAMLRRLLSVFAELHWTFAVKEKVMRGGEATSGIASVPYCST